jgi:hypothetical protein
MHRLKEACHSNAFIRNPVATKEMWEEVQDVHPKTLSLFVVVEHYYPLPGHAQEDHGMRNSRAPSSSEDGSMA